MSPAATTSGWWGTFTVSGAIQRNWGVPPPRGSIGCNPARAVESQTRKPTKRTGLRPGTILSLDAIETVGRGSRCENRPNEPGSSRPSPLIWMQSGQEGETESAKSTKRTWVSPAISQDWVQWGCRIGEGTSRLGKSRPVDSSAHGNPSAVTRTSPNRIKGLGFKRRGRGRAAGLGAGSLCRDRSDRYRSRDRGGQSPARAGGAVPLVGRVAGGAAGYRVAGPGHEFDHPRAVAGGSGPGRLPGAARGSARVPFGAGGQSGLVGFDLPGPGPAGRAAGADPGGRLLRADPGGGDHLGAELGRRRAGLRRAAGGHARPGAGAGPAGHPPGDRNGPAHREPAGADGLDPGQRRRDG